MKDIGGTRLPVLRYTTTDAVTGAELTWVGVDVTTITATLGTLWLFEQTHPPTSQVARAVDIPFTFTAGGLILDDDVAQRTDARGGLDGVGTALVAQLEPLMHTAAGAAQLLQVAAAQTHRDAAALHLYAAAYSCPPEQRATALAMVTSGYAGSAEQLLETSAAAAAPPA